MEENLLIHFHFVDFLAVSDVNHLVYHFHDSGDVLFVLEHDNVLNLVVKRIKRLVRNGE